MRLLTDEQHKWLLQHSDGISSEALTEQLNEKFNASFTKRQIRTYKKNHCICSMYKNRSLPVSFPDEVINFLTCHCKGVLCNELTEMVNKQFGTNYTVEQIRRCKKRRKMHSGCSTRLKPGTANYKYVNMAPETKARISRGWFKKGEKGINYIPVGSERLTKGGYTLVKAGNNEWQYKHRLIYERHYGPVPEGCFVSFRDGDKTNLDPANLVAISLRALRWVGNHHHLDNKTDDVIGIAETVCEIKSKIRALKKAVGGDKDAVTSIPE